MITADLVKELREMTGAGMMECKKALEETNGDIEKGVELLRERGIAKAGKKAGRIAAEGLVESYIHGEGRIGVLVEVNIETDFAAKNEEFKAFVKDIAMHIAAAAPKYVRREDVPEQEVQKEIADLEKQGISLEDIYSEEDIADIEELLNIDVEKTMQEARTEANIHWFVVALVYVVGTELALFLAGKKVSIDSLPDSREDATPEKALESTNTDNTFVQSGINPTVENNLSQEESAIQDNTQDIKFDL